MPVINLEKFNSELENFSSILMPKQFILFHKVIAIKALRGIVLKTPVDTGRARGNWIVTINVPAEDVIEDRDKRGGTTLRKGVAEIGGLDLPFQIIFITNNLEYISFLEEGSSDKAPEGMVAVTITALEGEVAA